MASIEKRLVELEAQAGSTEHRVRVYFCDEGDDEAQKRLDAGIPVGYAGKVICVQFITCPTN